MNKRKRKAKRLLALILSFCMMIPATGDLALAASADAGLCEHHTEHTEDCGYQEGTQGHPCGHVHDETCGYVPPTEAAPCTHVHDGECGYAEASAEVPCDQGCADDGGDGQGGHKEGCAYRPAVEGSPCTHVHDESCGYAEASEGQPCTHIHDEACGYAEAAEASPCTFVCELCSGKTDQNADGVQIQTFSALSEEIRVQEVYVGTGLEELGLPSELSFTDGNGETVTLTEMTWQSAPEFNGEAAGEYVFTPVLPETYSLKNDTGLPEIVVRVIEENGIYQVGSTADWKSALEKIQNSADTDATIVLTADRIDLSRKASTEEEKALVAGSNAEEQGIIGAVGKHLTIRSEGENRYTVVAAGRYLVGDVTFDNVTWNKSGDLFANGFLLEFTRNFDGGCHDYVYGGSDRRAVESTHLIFNAGSFGNPSSSYLIYGGGYAGGMGTPTGPSLGIDGEPGKPGWTPPEFEPGTGDVEGDIVIEIGGTAKLTALVGGCRNGNVGGNVSITLQADSADTRTVSWLTGAGYANQKGYGHVMGDVTINALSGNTHEIFGTGYGTLPEGCEPGDVNSVAGDVTITVGQESGDVPMYLKGTGCNVIGCGFEFANGTVGNTVCGDVKIVLNKTAKLDDGDGGSTYNQSMYGVYSNSSVRGSVTITNNGAEALFNMVGCYDGAQILGTDSEYALKMVMNGGHLRKTSSSYGSMFTTQRRYGNEKTVKLYGDVKMEFNGGYTWGIEGEYSYKPTLVQIDGDVEITVTGGTIYGNLLGGKAGQSLTEGHTATLVFDGYESGRNTMIPYAQNFDEVRVTGNSSVIIAAKDGAGTSYDQPFYEEGSVKNLTIDEGSVLALAKNASISGNLTAEGTLALPRTSSGGTTTLTAGGTASGTGLLKPVSSTWLSLGFLTWSTPKLNEEYVYAVTDGSDMTLELSQDADSLFVDRKSSGTAGQDVWFINERKETEQPWYYEVYYETFNEETGESEWNRYKHGQGGTVSPDKTVSISSETFDGEELGWDDLTGEQTEKLGTHYIYDPNYGPHRLSAKAGEATKENPLKIYYRAALHNVVYQYEGTVVPSGAEELLPQTEQKPYYSTVTIADAPVLSGYEFSGWEIESPGYLEENGLVGDGTFTMPNETVTLVGSWKKAKPELISWYYEVLYQSYNVAEEAEEDWLTDENGYPYMWKTWRFGNDADYGYWDQTVKLDPETYYGDNGIMDWNDVTGEQKEQVGVHYVYDESFPNEAPYQQRLSAKASEATRENPLKVYYRAAVHDVIYQYEGDVPEGADALLPQKSEAPYRAQVKIAEAPRLDGYTFSGWKVEAPAYMEEKELIGDGVFTMPNENVKLVGSWTKLEEPAAKTVTLTPQDMIAYTGGDSLSGDTFPTARYKVEAAEDVELSKVSFQIEGRTETLPEGTESGDIVVLPWLNDTFTLQESGAAAVRTVPNDAVAGEYEIGIDTAEVTASYEGGNKIELTAGTGTLTVRNVSEPEAVIAETVDVAQPIVSDPSQVNTDDGIGIAVIPEGTGFHTNGRTELGLLGDNDSENPQIALLFDDLIPGEQGEDTKQYLIERAAKEGYTLTDGNVQFKYLDLINENDGNAWVSTDDGAAITIYWPLPEGVKADEVSAEVLHFKGLHREYRGDLANQVANCAVEVISAEIQDGNVVFELEGNQAAGSFSPFAICWTEKDSPVPPEPEEKTGALTVSKTVAGNEGDRTRDFHFTVTLSDASVSGTYGDMEFTDGSAVFPLKHGESRTAFGLPAGVTYTVAEQEADQDGYTTAVSGDTGVITKEQTAAAVFTNTRESAPPAPGTGNLVVSKTVSGNGGSTTKDFTFTVTLGDTSVSGTYGELVFEAGTAVFTLKHGESKTAAGLPAGVSYTVTESDNSGYTVTASGDTGVIEAEKTAAAAFHNHRDSGTDQGIDLTVEKVWKLDNGGTAADSVTVILRQDGKEYDTVKLSGQNGWRHTWYGLSGSGVWTVEEADVPEGFTMSVEQNGYTFTITNDDVEAESEKLPAKPVDPASPGEPENPAGSEQTGKPETPAGGAPQTGDPANPLLWGILLAISGAGVTAALVLGKKKRYRGKHRK